MPGDISKNVGIVGYWYATNYGSAVTYYALYKAIEKLGFSAWLVDIPEKEKDPAGEDVFSRSFLKKWCNITKSCKWDEITQLNQLFDTFVVGSDQVWTRDAIRIARYMFFLNFADKSKRRIAYAPSFGTDKFLPSPSEETNVRNYLRLFSKVSVREESGRKILDTFDVKAERVLDPVFLIAESEYVQIIQDVNSQLKDKEFILAYILDPTPDKEDAINKIESELKIPVVLILDGRVGTYDGNISKLKKYSNNSVPGVDVDNWINYFYHASFVITDSHHGMAMSIIFNKPMIVYANHGRGYTRFTSLMDLLNIRGYLIESSDEISKKMIHNNIGYDEVNLILNHEIRKSYDWLNDALMQPVNHKCITYNLDLRNKCTGCGACENLCPVHAIELKKNYDGFLNPVVDAGACTNCGICTNKCIILHNDYNNDINPSCFAAIADDKIRSVSSSGGFFTVAAQDILSKGGSVVGAKLCLPDVDVKHVIVSDRDSLSELRGSKYIQSSINRKYTEIKKLLDDDNYVLFTGMPCQVAGLKSYLGTDYKKLITVDLLCHGISSSKVFKKYQKDVLGGRQLKKLDFKAKKPWGWHAGINATFEDGGVYSKIIESDPYFVAYIRGLSKNIPCGTCPFNRLPRQGDITIGDFWKVQNYKKELNDNLGTSLVLVNNCKGRNYFDSIKDNFVHVELVPISYAVSGNGIIRYPYRLHDRRNSFFKKIDSENFDSLVNEMAIQKLDEFKIKRFMPINYQFLFDLAKIIASNYNQREVVIWGNSKPLSDILYKYFKIKVSFTVSLLKQNVNGTSIRDFNSILGLSNKYYLVVFSHQYDQYYNLILKSGYSEIHDFVYRMFKPIVIENLDLSKPYHDIYGNEITGNGILKKIIFRGGNNHVHFGKVSSGLSNVVLDLTVNCTINFGNYCNFTQSNFEINVQGQDGHAIVDIGRGCRFMRSLLRIFICQSGTRIQIGNNVTFGDNLRIHANMGNSVIIKDDCMVSRDVVFLSGDGHSIFDVNSKARINALDHENKSRNCIYLDEHVWIGDSCTLMRGADIGSGCIVGAHAVVKKRYFNNCSIVGSPSKAIKQDIAWCHDMYADNIGACGKYAKTTQECSTPIHGLNVLVIGGSQNNGINLVSHLLKNGNVVTIANRGHKNDPYGNTVLRKIVDVTDVESIKVAFNNSKYDVIFNDVAYDYNYVDSLLSLVQCKKYVQLSSMMVYSMDKDTFYESDFDPASFDYVHIKNRDYSCGKRSAEAILVQKYPSVDFIIVRIPYVMDTDRLDYYCNAVSSGQCMHISKINKKIPICWNYELGHFLCWIAAQPFSGIINYSGLNSPSLRDIISYIELKLNKNATILSDYDDTPFSESSIELDLSKIIELGYQPDSVNTWFWKILDGHISRYVR